ncbi:MAG: Oligopeptide transport system permease protein OppB, partial [uncultured Acetobacteraceae bacterium]
AAADRRPARADGGDPARGLRPGVAGDGADARRPGRPRHDGRPGADRRRHRTAARRPRPRPAAARTVLGVALRGAARGVRLFAPLRRAGGAGAVAGARLDAGAARGFVGAGGGAGHGARRAGRGAAALGAGGGRAGGGGAIRAGLLARHPARHPVRRDARLAPRGRLRRHARTRRGAALPRAARCDARHRQPRRLRAPRHGGDSSGAARAIHPDGAHEGIVRARGRVAPRLPQRRGAGADRGGAGRRRAGLGRADRRNHLRAAGHGQADLRRGDGQRLQPRPAGAAAGLRRDHAGDLGRRPRAAIDRPETAGL